MNLSGRKHRSLLLFLALLFAVCLTQLASDIYTPSVPAIAENLQTSIASVQHTIALYMLGVAITQLFYGPLSEIFGRKLPLVSGLLIMLLGTAVCWLAPNIHYLLFGRLLQGIGAGGCAGLWRSIFRDLYSGPDLSQKGSYLSIGIMCILPLAPVLGAYLQQYFGWRSIFFFMLAYALLAFILVLLYLPETNQSRDKKKIQGRFIYSTFKEVMSHRLFMGMALTTFFCYGALFAWISAAPVLLIKNLSLSPPAFGWISAGGGGGAYGIAAWINGVWVKKRGSLAMMRLGFYVMGASCVVFFATYLYFGLGVLQIVIPALFFIFGSTFIWPNAYAMAFTPFGHIAGYAGAIYSAIPFAGAACMGAIIAILPEDDQFWLACLITVCCALAYLAFQASSSRRQLP